MLNAIGGGETLFANSERNDTMKRQIKLLLDIMKSPLGTTKIQNFDAAITRELESLVTSAVESRNWELL